MSSEHLVADDAAERILTYADREIATLPESLQEDALRTVQQQIGVWLDRRAFGHLAVHIERGHDGER